MNDEVVHGIPSEHRIIREGDIVSLDAGVIYKGYHSDGELKSRNILCLQNLQPGVLTPIGRRGGTADVSTSVSTSLELPEVTIHRMIFAKS